MSKKERQIRILKIILIIAGWGWALILAALGLVKLEDSGSAGFFILLAAVLVLPLTWWLTDKARKKQTPMGAFIAAGVVCLAIGMTISGNENEAAAKSQGFASVEDYKAAKALNLDAKGYAAHREKEDKACRSDLKCWAAKSEMLAIGACKREIESRAKHEYEWTDGVYPAFAQYAWVSKEEGTVKYLGDQFKAQNGFGVFSQYRYSCQFDPAKGVVLSTVIEPGHL